MESRRPAAPSTFPDISQLALELRGSPLSEFERRTPSEAKSVDSLGSQDGVACSGLGEEDLNDF